MKRRLRDVDFQHNCGISVQGMNCEARKTHCYTTAYKHAITSLNDEPIPRGSKETAAFTRQPPLKNNRRKKLSAAPRDAAVEELFGGVFSAVSVIDNFWDFVPCTDSKSSQTPWPLVRKRTIPTEQPPLVDEI
jgi:hypothetical protein